MLKKKMLAFLADKHNDWIRMCLSFGADLDTAKDLVQSMYLRMHNYVKDGERIMYKDDEVNTFFIYVTLRNMYRTLMTKGSKYIEFEIVEHEGIDEQYEMYFEEADLDEQAAFQRLVDKVYGEIDSWHRYDKLLSYKYLKTDYSLREIAKGSGISLTSIFNSMRNNKKILRKLFKEDWEDFKNGDYDRI